MITHRTIGHRAPLLALFTTIVMLMLAGVASAQPTFSVDLQHTPTQINRGDGLATYSVSVANSGLNVGDTLTCASGTWSNTPTGFTFQWLRDGVPIAGATDTTYVLAAADAGTAIQCSVIASNDGGAASSVSKPAVVPAPYPSTPPPSPPTSITAPAVPANGGWVAGGTLTCNTSGTWTGSPTLAFQWLRNGQPIADATGSTYTLTAGDVATAAAFQCEEIGTGPGGSVAAVSAARVTAAPAPVPSPAPPAPPSAGPPVTGPAASATAGTTTVTLTLPQGLTPAALSGTGWTCSLSTVTCTSTASVAAGAPYSPITLSAWLDDSAPDTVTVQATASSDDGATASASGQDSFTFGARVPFGVTSFTTSVQDASGNDYTQAGGHPFEATTAFKFATFEAASGFPVPAEDVRDITINLPPGFLGNPQALPEQCPNSQALVNNSCPLTSAVGGVALTDTASPGSAPSSANVFPVYDMAPAQGEPAEFAFHIAGLVYPLHASVRSDGDYGLTIASPLAPQAVELSAVNFTFCSYGANVVTAFLATTFTGCKQATDTGANPTPFLTNPTNCAGPAPMTTLAVDSYQNPSVVKTYTATSPKVTGCDQLTGLWTGSEKPSITAQPDSASADSPAGLDVDVHVPQGGLTDPNGLATPALDDTTVVLPRGVTLSPSLANGLQACSESQIGLTSSSPIHFNLNAPACPDASKIGTLEVDTPLLANALKGSVYLAAQNANPFDSTYAIYLGVDDPTTGIVIKLAGKIAADPVTGQLTATFTDNPQLPFSDFKLDFLTGSRAALVTPDLCGTYTTTAALTPWSAADPASPAAAETASASDSFNVTSGAGGGVCSSTEAGLPFAPALNAGSTSTAAGGFTDFSFDLTRADGEQNISTVDASLPPGLLAKLAGVPLCPDADAPSGDCPAGSQVGTATVGVGAGADPLFIPQAGNSPTAVYLAGAYEGAPYSLVIVAPAQAGPFNLGTVVVRAGLFIDPETAAVTVKSDPLPQILDGVPLQYRDIRIDVNRPGFMVNPTSCDPMSLGASIGSAQGAVATPSARFQVGGCSSLGFSPDLAIALSGKGKTRSGDHPTLTATLRNPAGQANIQSAKVALPLSLALDPDNSQHVCNFATAAAVHGGAVGCASSTIVGSATAVTPLLDQPLTGPVYLVQGLRCQTGVVSAQGTCPGGQTAIRTLPSLLLPLRGQIALDLRAQTSVSGGKLVTTFASVPDAPVSQFTLQINGGPKGLLVVTGRGQSVCEKAQVGNGNFGAQSGKTMAQNMTLTTPCGKPAQLKVLSHKVQAGKLVLRVSTSERGKVTVTGNGLRSFGRTMGAGKHQLQVAVKPEERTSKAGAKAKQHAKAKAKVRHAGKPKAHAKQAKPKLKKVKVTVQVTPPNAKSAAKTFTVKM